MCGGTALKIILAFLAIVQSASIQNNPPKCSLHSWIPPKSPWQRLNLDFAGPFMDHYFLLVVEAYSKWIEEIPTKFIT